MSKVYKRNEQNIIPCEICLKEVPPSEAIISEASDYVRYYFGVECFATWKNQRVNEMW